jgi:hypothetical protein
MALIQSEDYPNKRIYLSADSVGVEVLPIDIYREHRQRRVSNSNNERLFFPMVSAFGNQQIGPGKFTPRFTNLAKDVRIIPYDMPHSLLIKGSLISTTDSLEGRDLFDRLPITSNVDIDYQPPQVEILTVNVGSGFTQTQDTRLMELWQTLSSAGVFTAEALGLTSIKVDELHKRIGLNPSFPLTTSRIGNTTTESVAGITLTHIVDTQNDAVSTTRS